MGAFGNAAAANSGPRSSVYLDEITFYSLVEPSALSFR
jgi:hypothetical protein